MRVQRFLPGRRNRFRIRRLPQTAFQSPACQTARLKRRTEYPLWRKAALSYTWMQSRPAFPPFPGRNSRRLRGIAPVFPLPRFRCCPVCGLDSRRSTPQRLAGLHPGQKESFAADGWAPGRPPRFRHRRWEQCSDIPPLSNPVAAGHTPSHSPPAAASGQSGRR